MQDHQTLLTDVYRAFDARDIETVLAAMDSAVDWPNGWEGGRVIGHDAVRNYWTRQWAAIDPHVEPVGFQVDGAGRVVVQVHQVVKDLAGTVLSDSIVEHIYQFDHGLIIRMDLHQPAAP